MTVNSGFDTPWVRWWKAKTPLEREAVKRWLARNPPPANWESTRVAWAYTEMPVWF